MSRLRKALEHVGIAVDRCRNMPLSAAWEALLSAIEGAKRVDLRKFPGWCSARGIEPEDVTQDVFDSYYKLLEEQSIQHNLRERWHRARRAWNQVVAIDGSGYFHIENTLDCGEKLPLVGRIPGQLRRAAAKLPGRVDQALFRSLASSSTAATAAWGGLAKRLSGQRRKPLSSVTVDGYARNLVLLAGYLVKDGAPIQHFASLDTLLDPDLLVRGLERMQTDILAERPAHRSGASANGDAPPHRDPDEPRSAPLQAR